MASSKSHIVLVPLPAQGHTVPMLYLASKLALQGLTVTLINADIIHQTLQSSWKSSDDLDIRFESIGLDFSSPNGFDEKNFNEQQAFAQAILRVEDPLAELLLQIHARGPPVTCVVSDFYHITAPYAVKKSGLLGASFWTGGAAWASVEFHLPQLMENGDVPVKEEDDKLISYLPGVELRSQDIPFFLHEREFEKIGDELSLFRSKRLKMESWCLVNTVHEFEREVFEAMKAGPMTTSEFVAVGPLFPLENDAATLEATLRTPDEACLPWLNEQAPNSVLYISFGSISFMSFKQFVEIALALEASSLPFLWAIRPNSVIDMNEEFFTDFVEKTRDRGLIVGWAPQLEVLQHHSTKAFLTHCGWNSMLESLTFGVPMLGWPGMFEQNTNAKLILENKEVGITFSRPRKDKIVPREEIEMKVRAIMEGEEGRKLKKNVKEFKALATNAASPGGSSHSNLIRFVDKLTA